jgi:hypothetical protein
MNKQNIYATVYSQFPDHSDVFIRKEEARFQTTIYFFFFLPLQDVPAAHDGRLCTALEPPFCIHYEICITKLHRESDIARVNKEMYFISSLVPLQKWTLSSPATVDKKIVP